MDDPMTRSRLDRVTGTQPIGAPDPKLGPLLFFSADFGTAGVPAGSFAISASPKYCKAHSKFVFGNLGASRCSDPTAVSLIRVQRMSFGLSLALRTHKRRQRRRQ